MQSAETGSPGVSVVIPTWNGLSLLTEYLPSVREALESYPGPWECLVIDDGGTDATARELPALFPAARYVPRERNEGFSAAANTGFEAAAHELVLLLNNDIRVGRDFLLPLAERFRAALSSGRESNLFAVVSLQINPAADVSVNPAFDGCRALQFRGGELRLPCTVKAAVGEKARDTALANGGCSLFSRAKVRELGGFCGLFNPFYYEDAELSLQALRLGWRIVFEPRSVVWHRPNSTTSHSGKVNTVGVRNSFFFCWMLLDNPGWWVLHLVGVLGRLAVRTLRGDFVYGQGFGLALCRVPDMLRCRKARGRRASRPLRHLVADS